MTSQLNSLVRLRQYELERERAQLARFMEQGRLLTQKTQELERQIELQRAELSRLSHTGQINIDGIRLRQQYLQMLAAQRVKLQGELAAAEQTTAQHRERLIAADQRLHVAEKLRERALHDMEIIQQKQTLLEHNEAWLGAARVRDTARRLDST